MAQIGSIQALRGVAAISVAFGHLLTEALKTPAAATLGSARLALNLTGVGVDLFFVISGFIMVYASRTLFGDPKGWRVFLGRRIARIVPLYWVMTTLFLFILILTPGAVHGSVSNGFEILKSYFFVPYVHAGSDEIRPIYKLGWTLDYEMFFYLAFAAALFLPVRMALYSLAAFFLGLVALGIGVKPAPGPFAFWSDPIILEFVMGTFIGLAYLKGWRLPAPAAAIIFLSALLIFIAANIAGVSADALSRLALRSVPAAAIVAAAALMTSSSPSERRAAGLFIALGDASYALYLSHPWVMRPLHIVWDRFALGTRASPWLFVALGLVASISLAMLLHHWLERPMTKFFQKLLATPRPAGATLAIYEKA